MVTLITMQNENSLLNTDDNVRVYTYLLYYIMHVRIILNTLIFIQISIFPKIFTKYFVYVHKYNY